MSAASHGSNTVIRHLALSQQIHERIAFLGAFLLQTAEHLSATRFLLPADFDASGWHAPQGLITGAVLILDAASICSAEGLHNRCVNRNSSIGSPISHASSCLPSSSKLKVGDFVFSRNQRGNDNKICNTCFKDMDTPSSWPEPLITRRPPMPWRNGKIWTLVASLPLSSSAASAYSPTRGLNSRRARQRTGPCQRNWRIPQRSAALQNRRTKRHKADGRKM